MHSNKLQTFIHYLASASLFESFDDSVSSLLRLTDDCNLRHCCSSVVGTLVVVLLIVATSPVVVITSVAAAVVCVVEVIAEFRCVSITFKAAVCETFFDIRESSKIRIKQTMFVLRFIC